MQIRADDGAQVSEHVLPALIRISGERLSSDIMVLNFGLHFNSHSRAQQYLHHISAVATFFEQHKVSAAVAAACPVVNHPGHDYAPSSRVSHVDSIDNQTTDAMPSSNQCCLGLTSCC
jgi:hypothetical protein